MRNFTRPFSVETPLLAAKLEIRHVVRISNNRVSVRVAIPASQWHESKRKGDLGHLYGVDISNFIYHATGVHAYYPTVDDRTRASGGVKVIELTYTDTDWVKAPNNVIQIDFINKRKAG
jgi:hypothetical protein